jgi:hypothetical protein
MDKNMDKLGMIEADLSEADRQELIRRANERLSKT